MRKDQFQLLDSIQKLTLNQFYLLSQPKTPQQEFLHLFGHRILVKKSMLNKNLDRIKGKLEGTFANSSLNTSLITAYIENKVQFEEQSALFDLLQGWVNYYPTIKTKSKEVYFLKELILQNTLSFDQVNGFYNFLTYAGLISVDIWRILRNKKDEKEFLEARIVKDELKEITNQGVGERLDANDLLAFVSGCIPKVLLNIILQGDGLPAQIKKVTKKLQCLYSNQSTEYYLRTNVKLGLLLRQMLLIVLSMDLSAVQQKFLMLIVMRYFYIYSFDRKYSAAQIFIHSFNKLNEQVRRSLNDEFALFFKIILKLGKEKFAKFIEDNSAFGKHIVGLVRKKPLIGYTQQSANPHNTLGISEIISIQRGAKATKAFEVLEDFSIFYFRIQVEHLDITVRLFYLGDIQGEKEVKTLLFTNEKVVGQLKNSVNAMKKGLYLFQFDNSYSWINNKKVFYENVVYTPLEMKASNAYEWIDDFYDGVILNEVANQQEILLIEYKKHDKRENYAGQVFVEKQKNYLRLRVIKEKEEYIYQVDNIERMLQKVKEFIQSKDNYSWRIYEESVQDLSSIENLIREVQIPRNKKQVKQEKKEPKKQQIGIEQYQDDEEQEEEGEYEVVRKQMEQSQIINDDKDSEPPKSQRESKQKQVIAYSQQQEK